jgi:hypothetical protein
MMKSNAKRFGEVCLCFAGTAGLVLLLLWGAARLLGSRLDPAKPTAPPVWLKVEKLKIDK